MKFTEEDIESTWGNPDALSYLLELLNGEATVAEQQEDLQSLIGTKWDEHKPNLVLLFD